MVLTVPSSWDPSGRLLTGPAREVAVIRFFDDNRHWLSDVLAEGRADRSLRFTGSQEDVAQSILSTLEGAMLAARPYGDLARFDATARQLLAGLSG
jgi:TetR/AcrR family transcriptional regulator, transcriptional repressor for nem operon